VVERIDLGVEYLGGMKRPTSDDIGKFAVVRLNSLNQPNFNYETQVATVADDTFASTLAQHLRGLGLTVDSSNNLRPRPRPRKAQLVDHFLGGAASSGSVGSLGWNLLGSGTPAIARSSIVSTSALDARYVLSTSSSTNDRSVLALGETETRGVVIASQLELAQAVVLGTSTLNVRYFFGLMGDFSQEPSAATTALGIYYDSAAGANWRIIARAAGAGSPVDTGVAFAASAGLVSIHQPTAGTHVFYLGNTALGSISSGIPTAVANLGFRLETLTNAAKSLRLSYFGAELNLAAANDDDTFLEA
jgi:hypothetical protein